MEEEVVEGGEAKKKKSGSFVIIIVILLFVLLIGFMGVIAWLITSTSSDENVTEAPQETSKNKNIAKKQSGSRGSDYSNIGPMYPLDPFTLNLLSDSGTRYVKCTIQLEQNTELLQPELEKKVVVIRDIIIRTLTSKTYEEVGTAKGKERLKDELVGKINEILTDGFVKNVFFADFVIS
ncbi:MULTISPECIES: flagellar basal body-associated protein FliL [unclassified Campylobacter]|uniref:flagellar basal body-associated protein FliL n=1 Tax=unclassified Campylobacter TaxID=2593542 RepID=UPI001237BA4C|nr:MULTISPECIES: flagellar basal body-associated protein FliL [unclassified Campylobacter]KAA6225169.1 flagellar basal body-associated protein FliL [Campylobacter sp. LR196d]KAA6226181.1 flagellar basal body-associated protein FliL [Campylobacter sp. LR185c]KAA6229019.1 flagellar basal body-associated protein FliL [Campylobacter sp. LR286c]KAA6231382.1 flagellar basal body-associated protein FliL [Campylobacter sp. LR264d]KAA6231594.1 flagellar basal body-associated protein FliL [Campylobacter